MYMEVKLAGKWHAVDKSPVPRKKRRTNAKVTRSGTTMCGKRFMDRAVGSEVRSQVTRDAIKCADCRKGFNF